MNNKLQAVLAGFVILISFFLFFMIICIEFTVTQKDIIIYILGVLSALDTQIISYYFGSSQGSREKTETMSKMMSTNDTPRQE